MLKEEYEDLTVSDLVCRHYTFRDQNNILSWGVESYIVINKLKDGYFFVREHASLWGEPIKFTKFHYTEVELTRSDVIFDRQRMILYREIILIDLGKNYNDRSKKKKNVKRLFRIKPLNVRDLYVQFKGDEKKEGVISYGKLPREIIELDMDPTVFDRAYIRRDGWLAWFIPNIGEYALSPEILYELL